MGVLDDAIREHLELKRKHGATDDEIARAEAEALGPARRAPMAEIDDEPGLGPAEPVVIEPVDDVAPPPAHDSREPAPEAADPDAPEPTSAVHDIDEEPFPRPAAAEPPAPAAAEPAPAAAEPEVDEDATAVYEPEFEDDIPAEDDPEPDERLWSDRPGSREP